MKNIKLNIALVLGIVSISANVFLFVSKPITKKIAYVRSSDLVYGYLGMKDAQQNYQRKSDAWKSNIDTLQNDYELAISKYTSQLASLSKDEKTEREKQLRDQQQNLLSYTQAINSKAKQEDDKMTQGVLNQINSYVEEYGKNNGYDVILGTTLSGSLLYGQEQIDITKEVLLSLNQTYKGENTTNGN